MRTVFSKATILFMVILLLIGCAVTKKDAPKKEAQTVDIYMTESPYY